MLRGIKNATSNWLGKAVLTVVMGLLVVSFAIWGIGDIFRGFGLSTVATVGSTEVTVDQFRNYYSERMSQITRQLGRPVTPDQARALIEAAVMSPILILMPVYDLDRSDTLYRSATRGQTHFTIHGMDSLRAIGEAADLQGWTLTVHLEVDTGMSRGGAPLHEATEVLREIRRRPRLRLAGIANHFASADTDEAFTRQQSERFSAWLASVEPMVPQDCVIHEANTFGVFRSARFHRSMARVGLALLGYAGEEFARPEEFVFAAECERLRPVARWVSTIVQTRHIEPGTPVGYCSTWKAQRPTRLGVVPVGYADGYPLALSNRAKMGVVLRSGVKAFVPVVGRVSMDQTMIDLTDVPESEAGLGAEVEVVGNDRTAPNHLPTLAHQAGTIAHELLCRLSPRLNRQYIAVEQPAASSTTTERLAI